VNQEIGELSFFWLMAVKFDPILGKLRSKDVIKQLDSDPASPKAQDAWVLKQGSVSGGGTFKAFMGLGFPYMSVGTASYTYAFSYRTKEGTTKRVNLT
jgi:hypothetical protein